MLHTRYKCRAPTIIISSAEDAFLYINTSKVVMLDIYFYSTPKPRLTSPSALQQNIGTRKMTRERNISCTQPSRQPNAGGAAGAHAPTLLRPPHVNATRSPTVFIYQELGHLSSGPIRSPSNTIAHRHIAQRFVTRTRPARSRTRLQTHGPAILAGLRGPRPIMPDLAPTLRLPET